MHLVLLSDCPPQPWRNGGGTTRELLRWPAALAAGANVRNADAADDWLVRVSVAEIACDGPFSAYPGVDRWFAVLDGAGVTLLLPPGPRDGASHGDSRAEANGELRGEPDGERRRAHARHPGDDALAFAGEAAPGCTLIDGPTSDLNLMVRRGPAPFAIRASMRLAQPGSAQRGRRPWRALYAHAPCRLQTDEETHDLPAGTLAWSDASVPETWVLADGGLAFWMSLEP